MLSIGNDVKRYTENYDELVRLYKAMTRRYFTVIAPRAVFMATAQLEALEDNPPLGGLERFSRPIECNVTIEKIIRAYQIADDEFEMGFRYPARDIPFIYETIQESIRLWIEMRLNAYNYATASIDELRAMEKVAKGLFGAYRHYTRIREREIKKGKSVSTGSDLVDVYLGILMFGEGPQEDISFVSYIDQYYDKFAAQDQHTGVYLGQHPHTPVPSVTQSALPDDGERLTGPVGEWGL